MALSANVTKGLLLTFLVLICTLIASSFFDISKHGWQQYAFGVLCTTLALSIIGTSFYYEKGERHVSYVLCMVGIIGFVGSLLLWWTSNESILADPHWELIIVFGVLIMASLGTMQPDRPPKFVSTALQREYAIFGK